MQHLIRIDADKVEDFYTLVARKQPDMLFRDIVSKPLTDMLWFIGRIDEIPVVFTWTSSPEGITRALEEMEREVSVIAAIYEVLK